MTWPFAVTAKAGRLHQVNPQPKDLLTDLAATFGVDPAAIGRAAALACTLGVAIDPVFEALGLP